MNGSALPGEHGSWQRLGLAVLLSAALHAWIAVALPVKPARTNGASGPVLEARLMAASAAPAAEPTAAKKPPLVAVEPLRPAVEEAKPVPEPAADPPAPIESRTERPLIEGPPGIPVPQIEDPEFYPARLLDEYPKPMADVELKYPQKAGLEEMSGKVTLLLLIDELGIVVEATTVEADPPGYFEEAAIEAFRTVLFKPGQRNGRAVKSRLVVQVAFDAKTESLRR